MTTPSRGSARRRLALCLVGRLAARLDLDRIVLLCASAALLLGYLASAQTESPALPDGTVLFSSSRSASLQSETPGDLYLVQADGTGLVDLTQHSAIYRDPVWSPDGREIAFQSDLEGSWRLFRMPSEGGTPTAVLGTGPLDFLAGWSPDGLVLLLVSLAEVNREVVLLRLSDGERRNLTHNPAEEDSPAFFPDGGAIVLVSDRVDRTKQIFRLDLESGEERQLTDLYWGAADPIVSPDGQLIAYATQRDAMDNMDLCVMSADGASPRTIWSATGRVVPGDFSPDGRWIVAEHFPRPSENLSQAVLVPVDGLSSPVPLADPVAQGGQGLSFRPASTRLSPIALPKPPEPLEAHPLALVGATLVDGTGGTPVPEATVLLRDGRISAIGPRKEIEIPQDALVMDVSGMTLLPGLINTHVHSAYDARTLEAWAQGGVTTVRDLGALTSNLHELEIGYALADATQDYPRYARLVAASPLLTTRGGYGALGVSTPEEAAALVDRVLALGADLIKIGIEDRQGSRTWPLISQELVSALVDAARAQADVVWVSAHVTRALHAEMALEAGVDELAHMIYDQPPDGLIERVVAAGVVWVPTLELWHGVDRRHGVGYGPTADANLLRFVRAGGTVALGTDYGGYALRFDLGTPLTEVRWMLAAGMTPMEVLLSATKNAAYACGLENEVGTLEVGKAADLIAVGGDPLSDLVSALRDLRLVIRSGVIVRDDRAPS